MIAVISVGVAWLVFLLALGLDPAGVKRWQGRGSRLWSSGGPVMFTGALIDLLVHWPAHAVLVATLCLLFTAAGGTCLVTGGVLLLAAKPRPAGGPSNASTGPSGS